MKDLLELIRENWELFTGNIWLFLFYGLLVFGISWAIHRYFVEVKLHNIPERESLQRRIGELEQEVTEYKEKLHQEELRNTVQEMKQGENQAESIGSIMKRHMNSNNEY